MLKKVLTVFLLAAFCVTMLPLQVMAARLEQTPLEKIAVVEQILYGSEQEGSLVDRTNKLEREVFGLPGKEALMTKVERIYGFVRENSPNMPSLAFKMSTLEWSLTQSVAKGPIKARLENLEMTVSGTRGSGSVEARVSRLMAITFSNSKFQTGTATLSKDTLVKIKMITQLDSRKNKTGESVDFEVAEDVYSSGLLLIPQGALGTGKLTKVEQAQNFGRDAKLIVNFETVEALDMTKIATILGEKAKKETMSTATAAGAGFAGMILLGPIGLVGAAFVHGKNITVPAGTTLFIQTQADVELFGMTAK